MKATGALIYDSKGTEYIDCVAGHGVLNIGHNHPRLLETIRNNLFAFIILEIQ